MKRLPLLFFSLLFVFCASTIAAQDSTAAKKKLKDFVQFNGYLKDLQVTSFRSADSLSTYGFIHNRLNFHFYPTQKISGAVEIRNRVFYGQQVQNTPGFGKMIDQDNGFVKMSGLLVDEKAVVVHTMIDRLWLDWSYKKWEVRAGRQRINWGKTLVWNPNDIFNAFSYTDFDYEEQPGSDALRISYFPTGMSAAEFAIKPGKKKDETVAAGLGRFNTHSYDIQFLGGVCNSDYVLGTGWAGNAGNGGFKGELTWFQPKENFADTSGILSATMSGDYSFKNSLYLQVAALYNNHPSGSSNFFLGGQTPGGNLSAKNLMPSDWSFFAQAAGNVSPLVSLGISAIYGADPDFIFVMPSVTYSISNNWDIMLLYQGVYLPSGNKFLAFNNIFTRLKWSF